MSAQQAYLVIAIGAAIAGLLVLLCAYLSTARPWMDDPAADVEEPELEADDETCAGCAMPFDPDDSRFDGRARHRATPWCRYCIDRCHEGDGAHRCPICATARWER